MSFYVHTPLVAFFINAFLAFLVLRADRKSSLHKVFSLFLIGMALWGLAIFGMRSTPDLETALARDKAIVAVGPVTSVLFYHFTLLFTGVRSRKWLVVGYSLSIIFGFLAPTNLVFSSMRQGIYGYAPTWGYLGILFMVTVYGAIALALSNLVRFFRASASRDDRLRAALMIVGIACVPLGGVADAIHMLEVPVPPLGILGNIIFGSLATIAILRYHLLDIRLVLRKGIAYTIVSGLVASIYALVVLVIGRALQSPRISIVLGMVVTVAVAIGLQPMLSWAHRVVDRWFYRDRYDQLKALEEFSQERHDVTHLDQLCLSLVRLIKLAIRTRSVCLLMPQGRGGNLTVSASIGLETELPRLSLRRNSPIVRRLRTQNGFLHRKDMDIIPRLQAVSLQERKILDQLDMEMLVPLKAAIDIAGILVLGPKLSGEDYSRDDQRLLTVVSRQVSVALDNARLYKEMQDALGQLHKTQEHLLRTERLRAVGEVASGVGHDLRNLLTVVVGRAQLALGRMDHSEKVKHDLEIIEGAALDSAEVVNRLQNFARSDNDRGLCLVKLNQVLLEMVEMLEPRLSQLREMDNIAIDVVLDLLDTECVRGRPSELREMLTNILINAVEAMPKGGKLTVTSRQENDTIVMSIEDTGVGITREVRKGIFEPFFTTKGSEGVGLGLSIARGVAKRHGGDITVSSRPGKGSIFVITLPVSKQIRPEKRALGKVRGPAGDLHVLVIDDDKAVAKVLSEILASAGYAVDLASSGKDGLALAQRKDYSLVITDLGMPGMSGPDVAKAINTMKPAIPTFLVTGWDVELQPAELVNLGITGIITKPFTKASILGQIKHAMK